MVLGIVRTATLSGARPWPEMASCHGNACALTRASAPPTRLHCLQDIPGSLNAFVTAGADLLGSGNAQTPPVTPLPNLDVTQIVAAESLNTAASAFSQLNATGVFNEAASRDKAKILLAKADFDNLISTYASKIPATANA